ncbi:uncharacterized protein [Mytilus edulis]|uniref:uncharacterized protein n=1 Tax=Mytilus edulis TaxID=6550 RepID=UPI0039EEAFEB
MKIIDKIRDMLLLILLPIALCGLTHAYVYTLNCPDLSQWTTRANGMCNISDRYQCLYDANKKQNVEACRDGPKFEAPGYKIQIIGSFESVPCANDRYQPITFWTNSNLCKFGKSVCTDEGQVLFSLGTTKTDSTCRCDYTKGYDFVVRPKSSCFCLPSEEDCSCFIRNCPSGFVLSPDYKCASVADFLENLQCPIPTISVADTETQILLTNVPGDSRDYYDVPVKKIVFLVLILLFIGVLCIIIAGIYQRNIYEDEHQMRTAIKIHENRNEMESLKDSLTRFEPTDVTDEILTAITENPCVLITGPFGSGKTITAHYIISKLENKGYETILVSNPEQIERHFHSNKKLLFLMDDILGKYSSNASDIIDKLKKCGSTINSIFKRRNNTAKMLITSRTYIFQLYEQYFNIFRKHVSFIHKNLISENLQLDLKERKKIYKSYFESDPTELIADNILSLYRFYPLMCSSYKGEHMLEYFKHPNEIVSAEISAMQRRSDISYLALAILVVFNNRVENTMPFGMNNSEKMYSSVLQYIFNESCFDQYPSMHMLHMTFMSLKGEFIKEDDTFLSFLCPELFDIVAVCIGGSFIQSILTHSSSVFIKEKLQLWSTPGNTRSHAITVQHNMENRFFRRLISDMNSNIILDVLSNKLFMSHENRIKFLAHLQKHVKSKMLVDKETGSNILHIVSSLGYSDFIHHLIRFDKHPGINKKNNDGETPLHIACQNGHLRCVQLLKQNKAVVNEKDLSSRTPIHFGCEAGNLDIVEYLIRNDAMINIKDKKGLTPLHIASDKGHYNVVKCLVENKAKINDQDESGKTPLHYACEKSIVNIVRYLVTHKAQVNKCDNQICSPLHCACICGNKEVAELLINNKASVSIKNKQGQSPANIAFERGWVDISDLLATYT